MFDTKIIAVKVRKHDPACIEKVVAELRNDPLLTERNITKRDMCRLKDGQVYDVLRILSLSSFPKIKNEVFQFLLKENPFVLLHNDYLKVLDDRNRLVDVLKRIYSFEGDTLSMPDRDKVLAIVEAMRSVPVNGTRPWHNEVRCVCEYLKRLYEKYRTDTEAREDIVALLYLFVNSDEFRNIELKNRAVEALFDLHIINYRFKVVPES